MFCTSCDKEHRRNKTPTILGLAALVVVVLVVNLGCGGGSGDVAGLYKTPFVGYSIELKADGTCIMHMPSGSSINGEYKIIGDTLEISSDGLMDVEVFTIKDGRIFRGGYEWIKQ